MIAAFVGVVERQLVCAYKKYNLYSKGQVTFIYIAHLKQQKVTQRCIGIPGVQTPKRQMVFFYVYSGLPLLLITCIRLELKVLYYALKTNKQKPLN